MRHALNCRITYLWLLLFLAFQQNVAGQGKSEKWVTCDGNGCMVVAVEGSENSKHKWNGPCTEGKANGVGTYMIYEGEQALYTYFGEYKMGIRSGSGKLTFNENNNLWEGVFENGFLKGKGRFSDANGDTYYGNFINEMMHGEGQITYGNGKKFEGVFKMGVPYTGKIISVDESLSFIQRGDTVSNLTSAKEDYRPQMGETISEYFDENWQRCEAKRAKYYRRIKYKSQNIPEGKIKDFYISGALHSEFECLYIDYYDQKMNFKVNEAKWYFENGSIQGFCNYGDFNSLEGEYVLFYENGTKSLESTMAGGSKNGVEKQWYANGKIKSIALFTNGELDENKYIEYDENGLGCLVQNEFFQKNERRWTSNSKSSSSMVNEKGFVTIKVKNDDGSYFGYNHFDFDQNKDYSIEASFSKSSGKGLEGYGIIFGHKDNSNFYAYSISELGYYTIYGQVEGVKIEIRDWFKSSAINKPNGWNQLKIFKFGEYMTFFINGEMVEKLKASYFRGNNCGFMAMGKGEFILGRLQVKEFVSPEELEVVIPENENETESEWAGSGSGFFISENGHIATNYHVIKDASEIQVEFRQNGKNASYIAKVLVSDKQNDLAILKIEDLNFKINIGLPYNLVSNLVDVGTEVFTLGYPLTNLMGSEIKFTDGKISSKTGYSGDINTYQITVPVQPGNSGGPLFDQNGNIVGIVVAKLMKAENVSYAIKSSLLKNLIDVLPDKINTPQSSVLKSKSLTEQIKILSELVPVIKVR